MSGHMHIEKHKNFMTNLNLTTLHTSLQEKVEKGSFPLLTEIYTETMKADVIAHLAH